MENDKQLVWYSDALEVLNPLRYHINELLSAFESLNCLQETLGKPTHYPLTISKAQEALDAAERFFTGKTS